MISGFRTDLVGVYMFLQVGLWAALLSSGVSFGALAEAKAKASANTLTADESIWLATHNAARGRYGRSPLQWDDALERDARTWADYLARTQTFEHSKARKGQGENLWMGTRGAYPPASMVGSWVEEEAYLKSGTFPDVSTSGNWADVGHATQLLWPSTTHVGCAKASSAGNDYFVCRYSPPGNWRGEAFDARRR